MVENEAKKLIETEGFNVLQLLEAKEDIFIFLCNGDDNAEIEIAVANGSVLISPT